ncbi:MAG: VIT domain-containing protein [Syntrophobacteraceae bacterium]
MRKALRHLVAVCAIVLSPIGPTAALAEQASEKTLSPYFLVEGDEPSGGRFPLKETDVLVTINGVIADIRVTQKYGNEGAQPINARYVFPASNQASVHGLKMTIGEQVVTAKIKEREVARQDFENAKREGKSASLLEQQRPNVFTMNVANILPGDEVLVDLHYTELLVPTDGTYELVYPTVVGPRYSSQPEAGAPETDLWVKSPYLKAGSAPRTEFNIAVSVTTAIPLQDLVCTSHKVDIQWDTPATARVALAPTGDFGGNRDFILRYRLVGKEIQTGLLLSEGEKENFFLLMVQPPERVKAQDIPPREYVFVLDVSGSMHGFPLDTAKVLIRDLISHLREKDLFNVILFSGTSSVMAPSSVPANSDHVASAVRHIDAQQGGGGTELAAALKTALALPRDESVSRSVVVITDGYIAAEKEAFSLIEQNLNRCNVFAFGIGSSVNRYLIDGVAKAGLGEPFVVTKPEEAPAAASRFRSYIQSPVLTNIQAQFKDFDVYDVEPPSIPDLFAQRPLVIFGKWRGEAKGAVEICGTNGAGPYVHSLDVKELKPIKAPSALPYLWARSRIARLSDYAAGTGHDENREEVTALGLNYSLLTRYTSFIAVLETVRNTNTPARDVDQPLPLPQNVSNFAVGGGMANAPEPELAFLIPLLLILTILFLNRRRMNL